MAEITKVPLASIRHRADARPRRDEALAALEESIAAVGLLNPITVRPIRDGYEVVAGSHRLQVAELLSWPDIDAIVLDLDDLLAEMAMIDENLVRTELSVTERARQTARRKALYEALHPETKAYVAGAHASNASQGNASAKFAPGFSSDTAARTGRSERAVQLDAERGEKIEPAALNTIVGTRLDTGRFLDEVKKISKPEQAAYVEKRLAEPAPARAQAGISARYAAASTSPLALDGVLFERFLKAAEWFDGLNTTSLLASAGRQRAVCCQRARGIIDKLEAMLVGIDR